MSHTCDDTPQKGPTSDLLYGKADLKPGLMFRAIVPHDNGPPDESYSKHKAELYAAGLPLWEGEKSYYVPCRCVIGVRGVEGSGDR